MLTDLNSYQQILAKHASVSAWSFDFGNDELPILPSKENSGINIMTYERFKELFRYTNRVDENAIYWFEIIEGNPDKDLLFQAKEVLKKEGVRFSGSNTSQPNRCLYLGKRLGRYEPKHNMTFLSGRIRNHLGYHPNKNAGGLQLAYWLNFTNWKLRICILECPGTNKNQLSAIESLLADHFNPMWGRH